MSTITAEDVMGRLEQLEARLPEVVRERDDLKKKLAEALEWRDDEIERFKVADEHANQMEDELIEAKKEIERLKEQLAANPFLKAFSDFVKEEVKRMGGVPVTGSATEGSQELTLVNMHTRIKARDEYRTLPEVSTLEPKGKVVRLIREGKLDDPKVIADITKLIPTADRLSVTNACKELARDQILVEGKAADRRVTFARHPDVTVE